MRKRFERASGFQNPGEIINPLDGLVNLADIMLVLVVGIMMALIMHWNVDISAVEYQKSAAESADTENAMAIDSEVIEEAGNEAENLDSGELERLGSVYFDEASGKYYIIVD